MTEHDLEADMRCGEIGEKSLPPPPHYVLFLFRMKNTLDCTQLLACVTRRYVDDAGR